MFVDSSPFSLFDWIIITWNSNSHEALLLWENTSVGSTVGWCWHRTFSNCLIIKGGLFPFFSYVVLRWIVFSLEYKLAIFFVSVIVEYPLVFVHFRGTDICLAQSSCTARVSYCCVSHFFIIWYSILGVRNDIFFIKVHINAIVICWRYISIRVRSGKILRLEEITREIDYVVRSILSGVSLRRRSRCDSITSMSVAIRGRITKFSLSFNDSIVGSFERFFVKSFQLAAGKWHSFGIFCTINTVPWCIGFKDDRSIVKSVLGTLNNGLRSGRAGGSQSQIWLR